MIQLYSLATPNGQKVSIALEEMELSYEAHKVDITKGEQNDPDYLKINPNGKIPAIIDTNGPDGKPLTLFESGAILIYLAEKSGQFLSQTPKDRYVTIQWLMFQMGGVGPMFGQFGHFFKYAKDKCTDPYPVNRYSAETQRLLGVLDFRLKDNTWLVGAEISIADFAVAPWVDCLQTFYEAEEVLGLAKYRHVNSWMNRFLERPAVKRGMKVCAL